MRAVAVLVLSVLVAGCGDDAAPADTGARDHPDVIAVEVTSSADGRLTVAATISSPYDTPDRYADAFRVLAPDGTVLGVRELAHDHAAEQPFTRSLAGLDVDPCEVRTITVEGRDLRNGWGGATVDHSFPPCE